MLVTPRHLRRLALAGTAATLLAAVPSGAQIAQRQAAADRLQAAVAAESRRIAATTAGLADAQQRLATLESRAQQRRTQLTETQDKLVRARIRLSRLERQAVKATHTLRENLVTTYKAGAPSMVDVMLNADGFDDLLQRVDFFRRVADRNGHILDDTREAKAAVAAQTERLTGLRKTFARLSEQADADRDQAAVIRNALLRRQAAQLRTRANSQAQLTRVRGEIRTLERRAAAAAAAAAARQHAAASATQQAPAPAAPSPSSGPSDTGGAVAKVVAAANEIATTPYVWGGGHGGASGGYDCSGSISYALAAAGLVSSPLTSGGFMSWGEPGPGQHITVYANGGHVYMVVDGRRYDTSALSGGGTRWTSEMRSSAGFVARHPPGL